MVEGRCEAVKLAFVITRLKNATKSHVTYDTLHLQYPIFLFYRRNPILEYYTHHCFSATVMAGHRDPLDNPVKHLEIKSPELEGRRTAVAADPFVAIRDSQNVCTFTTTLHHHQRDIFSRMQPRQRDILTLLASHTFRPTTPPMRTKMTRKTRETMRSSLSLSKMRDL